MALPTCDSTIANDQLSDRNSKTSLLTWINSQTTVSSLILYAYLYWWSLIMLSFGYNCMPSIAWINASVLATFVCVALNAAAYHPPLYGTNGYLTNYFKIGRFWIIPFCVSSISVACNTSATQCKFLFPTDHRLLIVHIVGMFGILVIGCFVHQSSHLALSKCANNRHLSV
eukprot:150626_1